MYLSCDGIVNAKASETVEKCHSVLAVAYGKEYLPEKKGSGPRIYGVYRLTAGGVTAGMLMQSL